MKNLSATPKWQLLLIPILLLILIGVVWNNFSANSSDDIPDLLIRPDHPKTVDASPWKWGLRETTRNHNPFHSLQPDSLEAVVRKTSVKPFDIKAPGAQVSGDELTPPFNDQLQDLAEKPVTLLIRKGKKDIAVIGDRVIQSGQRLDSGHEVQSIHMDRILLSNPNGMPPTTEPTHNSK